MHQSQQSNFVEIRLLLARGTGSGALPLNPTGGHSSSRSPPFAQTGKNLHYTGSTSCRFSSNLVVDFLIFVPVNLNHTAYTRYRRAISLQRQIWTLWTAHESMRNSRLQQCSAHFYSANRATDSSFGWPQNVTSPHVSDCQS